MRHPGRAVDRHLDRGFDSTRQSFGFSFARITIYVCIYICFASNIFLPRKKRIYRYFDLIFRERTKLVVQLVPCRNEGV